MGRMRGTEPGGHGIAWSVLVRAVAVGLAIAGTAAAAHAVLDREVDDLDDTGWVLVSFALLLGAYVVAGWIAQRRASGAGADAAPLTHGALAGVGTLLAWLPIRVVIWLVRDEQGGLVRGPDAALRPGQLFGGLVIAALFGMLGALAARRHRSTRRAAPDR